MRNWRPLLSVVAVLSIASFARSADAPGGGAEQKVLDRELGTWKNTYKVLKTEWTPQERAGTERVVVTRAVGGRFVQAASEDGDGSSSMRLLTYDEHARGYRGWWFSSAGQTAEHRGTWDGESKTLTWTSVGDAARVTTVQTRFVDDDHTVWDVTVKDAAGRTLFRMEGTGVRAKEA